METGLSSPRMPFQPERLPVRQARIHYECRDRQGAVMRRPKRTCTVKRCSKWRISKQLVYSVAADLLSRGSRIGVARDSLKFLKQLKQAAKLSMIQVFA